MVDKIKETLHQFQQCQDLENWLRLFSILTWNKIGFARTRKRLKIYETTVSQDLLFNFRLLAEESNLPIEIYESISEKTNGNDFEILLEVENGYIMLPCQAKIVWSGDNYKAISHTVGKNYQINLLTKYAIEKKGVPIYLFYNYCENFTKKQEINDKIEFDIDEFGCSIVSAQYVKENFFEKLKDKDGNNKWIIPTFYDFHPFPAIPFHYLATLIGNINMAKWTLTQRYNEGELTDKYSTSYKNEKIKVYSREELLKDRNWRNLVPEPRIGRVEPKINNLDKNDLNYDSFLKFSPKFRFLFSKVRKKTGVTISILR